MHNSPGMSRVVQSVLTPIHPEVLNFTLCNTADIDWYVRMPTDPPLVASKDEMQLSYVRKQVVFYNQHSSC